MYYCSGDDFVFSVSVKQFYFSFISHLVATGDAVLVPPVGDWSDAVAEEERRQEGYYTDSSLTRRPRSRRGWARGRGRRYSQGSQGSYQGSVPDLGELL